MWEARAPCALRCSGQGSKDAIVSDAPPKLRYHRVIVKLSGEALCGKEGGFGIDTETLKNTAAELGELHETGVQIGVVVGGGNIFRGLRGASEAWIARRATRWACWPR